MDAIDGFKVVVAENVGRLRETSDLRCRAVEWLRDTAAFHYSYNFAWLGRPIIQVPQDMAAVQELIWKDKPDLMTQAGAAHGSSQLLNASIRV